MLKSKAFLSFFLLTVMDCSAATINFGGLTQAGTLFNNVGTPYSQDGFVFSSVSGGFGVELGAYQSSNPNHPAGGSTATSLVPFFALMTVTIAPAIGTFDLASIDIAEYGANQGGGTGTFTETFTGTQLGGGTVSQTFTITRTPTPTLSTFSFSGFTNLTQVSFIQGTFNLGGGIQINNLVVGSSGVPEPAIPVLATSGLVALLAARMRRPGR